MDNSNNYRDLDLKNLENLAREISNSDFVLCGEASHGTFEYYDTRSMLTKNLVNKHNFNVVLFETEWSLGYRMNMFIHDNTVIKDAEKLLKDIYKEKYPKWMWCNSIIINLLKFLKDYNMKQENITKKVYLYGVDCQDIDIAVRDLVNCGEEFNCKMIKNVITNYKENLSNSNKIYWNERDSFWKRATNKIKEHHKIKTKFILWAHNSHIGNAKAYLDKEKFNIGRYLTEFYNDDMVCRIGFTCYKGTVTASNERNTPGKIFKINIPEENTYEDFFYKKAQNLNKKNFIYDCNPKNDEFKLFRYIGTVYKPLTELISHYKKTNIDKEFNYLIFFTETNSLTSCFN